MFGMTNTMSLSLNPPEFDPSLFSNISFNIKMDPTELAWIVDFLSSLGKLQTPNASDFHDLLNIVDQTFPSTHQLQLF